MFILLFNQLPRSQNNATILAIGMYAVYLLLSRAVAGRHLRAIALLSIVFFRALSYADTPSELRVGRAGHAFDHLGAISEQGEAAAASGSTIIYVSGLGSEGYSGLPEPKALDQKRRAASTYVHRAKSNGIRLAIGYICATSIVKLETFDQNWTPDLRAKFQTPPARWRQQNREGKPLPSWYAGDYQPACMNNPDWRTYEKLIVRLQLETGCDGIFFDNPTVHPEGCFCPHCMEAFRRFLEKEDLPPAQASEISRASTDALRELAVNRTNDFRRFRCTIAREFLAEMRRYARTIKTQALVTCNNSLNASSVLYSQCRNYAYNIFEMSRAEDWIVVEDMSSQPRILANGQAVEYGPTYKQLAAIGHGKPVVAVTLADADYHTPARLCRLAMAEAAANGASYMLWPTWPQERRAQMIAGVRPQADLLRSQESALNDTRARRDAVLFLPFRRWLQTTTCAASGTAAALSRANVQYEILSENNFSLAELKGASVLLVESPLVFNDKEQVVVNKFVGNGGVVITEENAHWLDHITEAIKKPSVVLSGPSTLRVTMRDQRKRTIVHVLNLNIQRLSSFEDKFQAAKDVHISCRVPFKTVRAVRAASADPGNAVGLVPFKLTRDGASSVIETTLPEIEIATILVIEP